MLRQFESNRIVAYAFYGIRAGVLVLILRALISMYRQSEKNLLFCLLAAGAFVSVVFFDVNVLGGDRDLRGGGTDHIGMGGREGKIMIFLELFWTFFKIGAFTFGGWIRHAAAGAGRGHVPRLDEPGRNLLILSRSARVRRTLCG